MNGTPPGAGRGAVPGPGSYRPTPVRASPCHPLPGEGFVPRRRKPSPTGKVARAKPVTDEGKQPDGHSNPRMNGKRCRGGTRSGFIPPHTRHGFAEPPSPRRGFVPSSVPGCARSTFPVGEGILPAGEGCLRRGRLPPAGALGRKNPRAVAGPGVDLSVWATGGQVLTCRAS